MEKIVNAIFDQTSRGTICGIRLKEKDDGDTLMIPENLFVSDDSGVHVNVPRNACPPMPGIKKLVFPNNIAKIEIPNQLFPNLEEISLPENKEKYVFDRKSRSLVKKVRYDWMFNKEDDNPETVILQNTWFRGDVYRIPETISDIAAYAFDGTDCEIIPPATQQIRVSEYTFAGSGWLQRQAERGYFIFQGKLSEVGGKDINKIFVLPDEVQQIVGNSFWCNTLVIPANYRNERETPSLPFICKKLIVHGVLDERKVWLVKNIQMAESVFPDEKKSKDGVIYSADGQTLLFVEAGRPIDKLVVREGVKRIAKYALTDCKIGHVILPESLVDVGEKAFSSCKIDCLEFPKQMEYLSFSSQYTRRWMLPDLSVQMKTPQKLVFLFYFMYNGYNKRGGCKYDSASVCLLESNTGKATMNYPKAEKNYHHTPHLVYDCQYHVIFCPKYRRKVLTGPVEKRMKEVFLLIAKEKQFQILDMEIMPDHVHLLIDCNPRFGVMDVVKALKGISSRTIREEFPVLKKRIPTL